MDKEMDNPLAIGKIWQIRLKIISDKHKIPHNDIFTLYLSVKYQFPDVISRLHTTYLPVLSSVSHKTLKL